MLQRSVLKKAYILSSRQLSNRRERITADPVFRVREVFHVRAKLSNIGLEMDEADERAGNKIVAPVHVLWGAKNSVGQLWDVLATWRAKAASTVTGRGLDCGHFLQEERPEETFEELQHFFGTA